MPRRRWPAAGVAVVALTLGAVGLMLVGNDYRLSQRPLTIPSGEGTLDAVLSLPASEPAHGLVVFVHGDGPVDTAHDGLYLPWFEAAADAGFATLSWSKPGVGDSSGDWLDQSMKDRAEEVSAVIAWAKRQSDIPTDVIVLWGISQAGWVLPTVATSRDDIDSIVAVSPAVNWLRQGRYNLLAELEHEDESPEERARAVAISDQRRALLERGADHGTYRATVDDPEPLDADRWRFAARNYRADATGSLTELGARDIPVLLMLGEHDRNVDIEETATVYTDLLGADLTVERFDASHSMADPAIEDSTLRGWITATFWPRALFADGVLETYTRFLDGR